MLRDLIESRPFERLIVICILLNAVTLGVETLPNLDEEQLSLLKIVDRSFLFVFTAELVLKLAVYRLRFFRDGWNIFDFLIVSVSLIPATGALSVLRSLRVLRALRMISVVPSLRKVVNGLLVAVPGLGAVGAILALVFYSGAVMATKLFGVAFPEWFGSIWKSAYTLFQVMTLESWSMGIVRPVLEVFPYSWMFFLPFIILTTFTMLNLFIAVIVNALHIETDEAAAEREKQGHDERGELLEEIRLLHEKVDKLTQVQAAERRSVGEDRG